jgi:UMF1 family MFS transporter
LGFGTIAIAHLNNKSSKIELKIPKANYSSVLKNLRGTVKGIRSYPNALLFLIAYLFYNDGIQTVIIVAAKFGSQKIGISIHNLALIILMIQFIAYFGSILVYKISYKIGSKSTLLLCLSIWITTIIFSYFFLKGLIFDENLIKKIMNYKFF